MAIEVVSTARRTLYYSGLVLICMGALLFVSNFIFLAFENEGSGSSAQLPRNDVPMSDPQWWEKSKAQHDQWWAEAQARHATSETSKRNFILRAICGMVLIVIGGLMRKVGWRGWAGSGLLLNPQQARIDLEPWSRMGGKVLKDALSELDSGNHPPGRPGYRNPHVMIRCRRCEGLSGEHSRYCGVCGAPL